MFERLRPHHRPQHQPRVRPQLSSNATRQAATEGTTGTSISQKCRDVLDEWKRYEKNAGPGGIIELYPIPAEWFFSWKRTENFQTVAPNAARKPKFGPGGATYPPLDFGEKIPVEQLSSKDPFQWRFGSDYVALPPPVYNLLVKEYGERGSRHPASRWVKLPDHIPENGVDAYHDVDRGVSRAIYPPHSSHTTQPARIFAQPYAPAHHLMMLAIQQFGLPGNTGGYELRLDGNRVLGMDDYIGEASPERLELIQVRSGTEGQGTSPSRSVGRASSRGSIRMFSTSSDPSDRPERAVSYDPPSQDRPDLSEVASANLGGPTQRGASREGAPLPDLSSSIGWGERSGSSLADPPPVGIYRHRTSGGEAISATPTTSLSTSGRERGDWGDGLTGLQNLGNTCFMNSAVQCLSQTPPLKQFFLDGSYERDINTSNPLGKNGDIAHSFAEVLRNLWKPTGGSSLTSSVGRAGRTNSYCPRAFKKTMSDFAPNFSGWAQQDAQEFLGYLMDGLHEDLNRVKQKRTIQIPDDRDGKPIPDLELAKLSWEAHEARNRSCIVDLFYGQTKSTVECPNEGCKRVSVTFDPFNILSVPVSPKATPPSRRYSYAPTYSFGHTSKPFEAPCYFIPTENPIRRTLRLQIKVDHEAGKNKTYRDVMQTVAGQLHGRASQGSQLLFVGCRPVKPYSDLYEAQLERLTAARLEATTSDTAPSVTRSTPFFLCYEIPPEQLTRAGAERQGGIASDIKGGVKVAICPDKSLDNKGDRKDALGAAPKSSQPCPVLPFCGVFPKDSQMEEMYRWVSTHLDGLPYETHSEGQASRRLGAEEGRVGQGASGGGERRNTSAWSTTTRCYSQQTCCHLPPPGEGSWRSA